MTLKRRDRDGASGNSHDPIAALWLANLLADERFDRRLIDLDRIEAEWRTLIEVVLSAPDNLAVRRETFNSHCEQLPGGGTAFIAAVVQARPGADAAERQRYRLLTPAQIEEFPDPDALIDGHIYEHTLVGLTGEQESFKSFIAVDMAACIATGTPWYGHPVKRGRVVYVSGEGRAGFRRRIRAWQIARRIQLTEAFRLLPESVQLLQPRDVDDLLIALRGLPEPPALVVIDTLARSFAGGDENSARDMGQFIAACDRIKQETGATVLLAHHVARAGNIRGSTALPGALDTWLAVKRDGDIAVITCEKAKDADHFEPIRLARHIVELDDGNTSVVLNVTSRQAASALSGTTGQVLGILRETFGEQGATASDWAATCIESGISRRAFFMAKKALIEQGKVIDPGEKRGARFRLAVLP